MAVRLVRVTNRIASIVLQGWLWVDLQKRLSLGECAVWQGRLLSPEALQCFSSELVSFGLVGSCLLARVRGSLHPLPLHRGLMEKPPSLVGGGCIRSIWVAAEAFCSCFCWSAGLAIAAACSGLRIRFRASLSGGGRRGSTLWRAGFFFFVLDGGLAWPATSWRHPWYVSLGHWHRSCRSHRVIQPSAVSCSACEWPLYFSAPLSSGC